LELELELEQEMVQMSGSEAGKDRPDDKIETGVLEEQEPLKDEIGGDECGEQPGESLPLAKEVVSEGAGADRHGEDAYGSSSQRALRAFDSIPGDSEHQVDYPVKESEAREGEMLLAPQIGYGDEALPNLSVELVVTTPDGRSFVFAESLEVDTAEYEEIAEMIQEVARSATGRFVSRAALDRRQTLGL
jgi:hypothetical protein